jgi:hypothetical protein
LVRPRGVLFALDFAERSQTSKVRREGARPA